MVKKMTQVVIVICFLEILVGGAYSMKYKRIPIVKSGVETDDGIINTTQPLLVGKDIMCEQDISRINYSGDLEITYFTSQRGFAKLVKGENVINGSVKAIWISLGGIGKTGEMSVLSDSGVESGFQYEMIDDQITVECVKYDEKVNL